MLTTLSNVFSATSAMVPSTGIDGVAFAMEGPVRSAAPVPTSPTAARPASALRMIVFMDSIAPVGPFQDPVRSRYEPGTCARVGLFPRTRSYIYGWLGGTPGCGGTGGGGVSLPG